MTHETLFAIARLYRALVCRRSRLLRDEPVKSLLASLARRGGNKGIEPVFPDNIFAFPTHQCEQGLVAKTNLAPYVEANGQKIDAL